MKIESFVRVVDERRKTIGMTTRALSQKTGIPENALYAIFGGTRKMTASELLSLASELGLSFDDFAVQQMEVRG